MASGTRYSLAQFIFNIGDEATEILCDGFKTTRKQDVEKLTSTGSHNAYAVTFGKEEYDWDVDDIDPEFRKYFEAVLDLQKTLPETLPYIATYDYVEGTGDLVEDDVYYGVWVEEISKDKANQPFSVKGGALRKQSND